MSIRFAIKSASAKSEKEGDTFIRFTGDAEPYRRVEDRKCDKVGVDGAGNAKLVFTTGLDEKTVQFYNWFSEEEKKAVLKQIKELRPLITDFYGGEEVVNSTNKYFWLENRDINRLSLDNETMQTFYDTKNPAHALLYLSILSGAFIEMVAPTRDWAERRQIPHFIALETDDLMSDDEDDITRSDAHAALSELRREESPDALFILAWCLQYETNAFGGINRATPPRSLATTHSQFIDGKLVSKKKRNMPRTFIDYAERWKGPQTRPALFVEAYIKAGEYFSYVNQRDKKYVTADGTILGNTIPDAVAAIMKPKFTQDLEQLRDKVEAKWKE